MSQCISEAQVQRRGLCQHIHPSFPRGDLPPVSLGHPVPPTGIKKQCSAAYHRAREAGSHARAVFWSQGLLTDCHCQHMSPTDIRLCCWLWPGPAFPPSVPYPAPLPTGSKHIFHLTETSSSHASVLTAKPSGAVVGHRMYLSLQC